MVPAMVYARQKRVQGIHKTQNSVEMLMHMAWAAHHHCPLAVQQSLMGGAEINVNQKKQKKQYMWTKEGPGHP